jgi:ribonuclease HI
MFQQNKHFEIYTDGSLKDGCGTWAYRILRDSRVLKENSGRTVKSTSATEVTTSSRMEFHAVIEALKAIPAKSIATVHSDSRILIDNVTQWMPTWKSHGWKKENGRPLASADQMQELDLLSKERLISWKWVRGHSGNPHNERCDELCLQARSY